MADSSHPLVSVIVAVHNVADHVGDAIASLRAQTLADFEAFVIDDGSTDRSAERARAAIAGDPRFVLVGQANAGLSAVRNRGLERARGRFVAFLDGDDAFDARFLETLVAAIERDGTDWAACAITLVYPDGSRHPHPAVHAGAEPDHARPIALADARTAARLFPSAWNKLYRRDFVGGARFPDGTWFEDHAFFWTLAARGRPISYVPRALVDHRRGRPGQITAADSDRVFEQFAVLDRLASVIRGSTMTQREAGLAQLATRLIHERALVLRQRDRRARFLRRAADWLARHGCAFDPASDPEISRGLALALGGANPVSVVVVGGGDVAPALDALDAQGMADFDLTVIGPATGALPAALPCGAPIRHLPGDNLTSDDLTAAEVAASVTGTWVVLVPGADRLLPDGLMRLVNLAADSGAPMAFGGLWRTTRGYHDGWCDNRVAAGQVAVAGSEGGRLALTGERALRLHPVLGNRIVRRDLLARLDLPVAGDALSQQVLGLAMALAAGETGVTAPPVVRVPDVPGVPGAASSAAPGALTCTDTLAQRLRDLSLPGDERLPRGWQSVLYLRLARFRAEAGGHGWRFWLDSMRRMRRAGLPRLRETRCDPETPLWLRLLLNPMRRR